MRKLQVLTVMVLLFVAAGTASAHPGRTDSNGGHYCRTNCEKWGLEYGEYHYPNGGRSSGGSSSSSNGSSSSSSSSASTTPWVDTSQQERKDGETTGYQAGLEDGYKEAVNQPSTSESTIAYQNGYAEGYNKGYLEGQKKLQQEKEQLAALIEEAQTAGYELGKKQDQLVIGDKYKVNDEVKQSFSSGFEKGVAERDEKQKIEYLALGEKHGKEDTEQAPKNVKETYIAAYQEGFAEGQEELKEEYVSQGYQDAFENLKYKVPAFEKEKYITWYKAGFESNKEIVDIQQEAYNWGMEGEDLVIPEEYSHAAIHYKYQYNLGAEQRKNNIQKTTANVAGFSSFVVLGWLGRRFYVAKEMLK